MTGLPFPAARGRMARPTSAHRAPSGPGRFFVAFAAVAGLGCIDPIDPDEYRIVGHIPPGVLADGGKYEPQIPGRATAGVPLEIAIWTFHWCAEDAGTEVGESGGSAVATPYIVTLEGACTLINKPIEHRTEVVFPSSGPSEIVLRYSRVGGGSWKPNATRVYDVMVHPAG